MADLYKKYRPKEWKDIIGQNEVVESLRKVAINENPPTGFLFAGKAGTGKTSTAFILAKALNCPNKDEYGNPCNDCPTCRAIDKGAQPGVRYISMANHGGVADVRELVQEARLHQPIPHPVYICDEIQNLSNAAFDSLLVPLESDRMQSIFIFCTTEPESVRPAVLSRLQIRYFLPVSNDILIEKLKSIIVKEGWIKNKKSEISLQALEEILVESGGSVRNAIANLETYREVGKLNGTGIIEVLKEIQKGSMQTVFKATQKWELEGKNFVSLTEQLFNEWTKIIIHYDDKEELVEDERWFAENVSKRALSNIMIYTGESIEQIRNRFIDYKILFEWLLVKILKEIAGDS